jgi:hypothetical protein
LPRAVVSYDYSLAESCWRANLIIRPLTDSPPWISS